MLRRYGGGNAASTSSESLSALMDCEESSNSSAVPSLLERLKSPTSSDLARKRKVSCNLPSLGMKRSKGGCSALHMKSVSPYDHVKTYPNEYFQVRNNKLFCQACR